MKILRVATVVLTCLTCSIAYANETAVEFFHAGLGHYFLTADPAEINVLGKPPFEEWQPTGYAFDVQDAGSHSANAVAVCRFYNDHFAGTSTHFYGLRGGDCDVVLAQFPDWLLEKPVAFYAVPHDVTLHCPAPSVPVYRAYNNGHGGAPNHRFTTSQGVIQQMVAEGYADEGVVWCAASVGTVPGAPDTAEGAWRGTTADGKVFHVTVLADGNYYIAYTGVTGQSDVGVVHGTGTSSAGAFTSTNAQEFYEFDRSGPSLGLGRTVSGTYVGRTTLDLTGSDATLVASYDATYNQSASLGAVAGTYTGFRGHTADPFPATVVIGDDGVVDIGASDCSFAASITPRSTVNVFDFYVRTVSGVCLGGPGSTATGILYTDSATGRLHAFAPFVAEAEDMFYMVLSK